LIPWEHINNENENRSEYFRKIRAINSPLTLLPRELFDQIVQTRTNDLSESADMYLQAAAVLDKKDTVESKTRAEFIKLQCNGISANGFFLANCESWGIPIFKENILSANDFRFGFLWRFRDHTTGWSENQLASEWFYTNIEANFARRWEFWANDNDKEEMVYTASGNYKEILFSLISKYHEYDVLLSPAFTQKDLLDSLSSYDETKGDYSKKELFDEFIVNNLNWAE
jgi:hypothetical protein